MPNWLGVCFLCLSYLRLKRVNVRRKRKGKIVFSFQGRYMNAKEISALDTVWVTFLDEQGYHLALSFYLREPVKFRKEKIVSTLQRKLLGYPDTFPVFYLLIFAYQIWESVENS